MRLVAAALTALVRDGFWGGRTVDNRCRVGGGIVKDAIDYLGGYAVAARCHAISVLAGTWRID